MVKKYGRKEEEMKREEMHINKGGKRKKENGRGERKNTQRGKINKKKEGRKNDVERKKKKNQLNMSK